MKINGRNIIGTCAFNIHIRVENKYVLSQQFK